MANVRIDAAHKLRDALAKHDAAIPAAKNVDNDDDALYADKCGTYTKGLPHDDFGRVDLSAYKSLKTATASGKFADYQKIVIGGTRTLNGPQGALQFDLEGLDVTQFGQPQVQPPPTIASDLAALELLEHYWASLLRDVAFTDYPSNKVAQAAAAEISARPEYKGPRDASGKVTPDLLFRGGGSGLFAGETMGPYVSQFLLIPAMLGQYPVSQRYLHYAAGQDFVFKDFATWVAVQNGNVPEANQIATEAQTLTLHDGRGLASYTRVDVLYQAYLTAFLTLDWIGAPLNPGNPYIGSKSENGFSTFGGPDFSATLAEVATRALAAVWYQKWNVHLRPRPEAIGGLVHLAKTGQAAKTDCKLSNVILNSVGLQQSFDKYKTWLLSQAFPEASPVHPSYPTGHGTVAGACITILKFFYDGNAKIADILAKQTPSQPPQVPRVTKPQVPDSKGNGTTDYSGADAGQLTVNGELSKLGHNVSFGHGIHAGIHWRTDTDASLLLGEAVALNFLHERARTYNEPFSVEILKFDGKTEKIANP